MAVGAPTYEFWVSGRAAWSLPPNDLPTFGKPATNSVKIAIYGSPGCIRRPGYYYLPKGSRVSGAIEAAQGLEVRATWGRFSGIQHKATNDTWEITWFSEKNRDTELSILLRDGDMIYVGAIQYLQLAVSPFATPSSDLPTFGKPSTNTIKTTIYGAPEALGMPGNYFLPRWTRVSGAIAAAQGLGARAIWGRSGIQRRTTNDSWEAVLFSSENRDVESSITLQDGDMIYIGTFPSEISKHPPWYSPSSGFPSYGNQHPDGIKVTIFGDSRCVTKPGFYFLPQKPNVSDAMTAIKAENGLGHFASLNTFSGIQRPTTNGVWEIFRFSGKNRDLELDIILKDGDMIFLGMRPYE